MAKRRSTELRVRAKERLRRLLDDGSAGARSTVRGSSSLEQSASRRRRELPRRAGAR